MTHLLKISLIVVAILVGFSGCNKRMMAPEEARKIATRTYPALTPDAIFRATSDLFFLADEKAFQQTQTPDHFIATRNHSLDIGLTLAQAKDTWKVEAKKTSNGTNVMLEIRSEETLLKRKTQVDTPNGPATYMQFWARLDYLLGQSATWMTCNDLRNEYLEDRTWGDIWWLCSDLTDRVPPELIEGIWLKDKGVALSVEDHNVCLRKVSEDQYGTAQSERQREVFRSICLQEAGYRKVKLPSENQPE